MKLVGEYLFDGPRDVVWELVRDPDVLASALPGTQSLEMVEENVYEGKMNVRIGPVAALFPLHKVTAVEENQFVTLRANSKMGRIVMCMRHMHPIAVVCRRPPIFRFPLSTNRICKASPLHI